MLTNKQNYVTSKVSDLTKQTNVNLVRCFSRKHCQVD